MAKTPEYYNGIRSEMLGYVPDHARRILEVGCGEGNFGAVLKRRGAEVWGVEYAPEEASAAEKKLDKVFAGDITELTDKLPDHYFDVIVCNDVLEHLTNPYGVLGTSPPFSPPLQFNLRARYDLTVIDYKPFVMVGANHVASQRNEPASFPDGNTETTAGGCLVGGIPNTTLCKYEIPGYTTYDAAVGVAKDSWTAQLSGSNITNSNAATNIASNQFIKTVVPLRPRVLTLEFGYKFR